MQCRSGKSMTSCDPQAFRDPGQQLPVSPLRQRGFYWMQGGSKTSQRRFSSGIHRNTEEIALELPSADLRHDRLCGESDGERDEEENNADEDYLSSEPSEHEEEPLDEEHWDRGHKGAYSLITALTTEKTKTRIARMYETHDGEKPVPTVHRKRVLHYSMYSYQSAMRAILVMNDGLRKRAAVGIFTPVIIASFIASLRR
jgi:hypothetical protein